MAACVRNSFSRHRRSTFTRQVRLFAQEVVVPMSAEIILFIPRSNPDRFDRQKIISAIAQEIMKDEAFHFEGIVEEHEPKNEEPV